MAISNNNWYDTNANQPYPVSELATGLDDNGDSMRDDILVDLHLKFPKLAGMYAYVGGITVTANLVSIVIVAADSPESVSGFIPLAAITVEQPVIESRHYAVTPLYPGVGGWVVFGPGVLEPFVGRYSTPQQSLILPRCATPYYSLPIRSLGKAAKDVALTGLVTIRGGTDIAVVKETRLIQSFSREVLIIKLKQDATGRNVLADYVSTCQARPESRNCDQPGIETISGVAPDCDGNIDLAFTGNNLYVAPFEDCGPGITLDSPVGLAALCAASVLPDDAYRDLCESESVVSESISDDDEEEEPTESESIVDEEDCEEPPIVEAFGSAIPGGWSLRSGGFEFDGAESASVSNSGSERNTMIFNACLENSYGHDASVELRMRPTFPSRNGGLVLNYHIVNPLSNPRLEYYLVNLDHNLGRLQVLRFSGSGTVVEYTSPPLQLFIERKYRITCSASLITAAAVLLNITLQDLDAPATLLTTALTTGHWLPANGHFGVSSFLSSTEFHAFSIT